MKITDQDLLKRARSFDFGEFWIDWRGEDKWAILKGPHGSINQVYNRQCLWEYEPSPSNRSDAFKKRTRYTLEEAVDIALSLRDEFADMCEENK